MTKTSRSSGRPIEAPEDHEMDEGSSIDKEISSPEPPRFKKMKPRVGNQFQTKVPKFASSAPYLSNRPEPEKLSAEYPHARQKDVNMMDGITMEEEHCNELTPPSYTGVTSTVTSFPVHDSSKKFRRNGGTCVHRCATSSNNHNHVSSFLHTAQHLLLPLPPEPPVLSNEAFAQEMISRYGSTTNTRRKKRRLASANIEWTSCEALLRKPVMNSIGCGEEDERMLEILQTRHGGNVKQAELGLRVHLSHGKARNARRIILQEWHSDRFKRPSIQSSASWRQRFERNTSLWGDTRDEPTEILLPFSAEGKAGNNNSTSIATKGLSHVNADDDMKGVWRSILAYAQSMERALATTVEGQKPKFSEVMNFLRCAYALPLPEESFGTRHVCVEQLSECFQTLLGHISKARDAMADISDFLATDKDGVDMEALRKLLDEEVPKDCSLVLDEEEALRALLIAASEWQERVDALSNNQADESERDCLLLGEVLATEARSFAVRTTGLVLLEKRIEKALQLEARLEEFNLGAKTNTVKLVAALVRDANRINLPSIQARKIWKFNKELEVWVDRANIAIRSRITLMEVESLIHQAKSMPLSLNEFLDKLNSRVRLATTWIAQLKEEVPCVYRSGDDAQASGVDQIEWMKCMRHALADDKTKSGTCSHLLDLCSEGVRIPVEIISMKMLQIEVDAKNWSQKAEKWIPRSIETKKGKVVDLREHLRKAELLRDRLPIESKEKWSLEFEAELRAIVCDADKWFEEFEEYLDWDNRRSAVRSCLSMDKLRRIVAEGAAIHAHIGNSVTKMARVLSQAEAWFEKNESLLIRAGILKVGCEVCVGLASLNELANAATAASSDISLDLEEAVALKEVVAKIQSWVDRTGNAAPIKRSKRVGKGRWSRKPIRFRIDDLVDLISEAKMLPIPTDDEVQRLNIQLNDVYVWRLKAHNDLKEIANGFHCLRTTIQSVHGSPDDFYNEESIRKLAKLDPQESPSQTGIVTLVDTMEIDGIPEIEVVALTDNMNIEGIPDKEVVSDIQEATRSQEHSNAAAASQDGTHSQQFEKGLKAEGPQTKKKSEASQTGTGLPEFEGESKAEAIRQDGTNPRQPEEKARAEADSSKVTNLPLSEDVLKADSNSQSTNPPKQEKGATADADSEEGTSSPQPKEVLQASSDPNQGNNAPQLEKESTVETFSQSPVGELDVDFAGKTYVERSIAAMLTEARLTGVVTSEEDVVISLESVSIWCSKSLKAIEKPNDLYDKRTHNEFNILIKAGEDLLETSELVEDKGIDQELARLLSTSWSAVVKEQLQRLDKLRLHRDKFVEWSKLAQAFVSARDKKITFDAVDDLAEQSREYPSSADIVQRVRSLHHKISKWKETATYQLYSPVRKMTIPEAKGLCEEGDKLKLSCHELKILRNAIRTTRSWMNRVKKCKVVEGGTTALEIERLIDEHSELIVAMPEEVEKLKQVMKGYCLCRRPYEGFMIGCDGCDEWYHGPCIGVSESQADRYEKYLCVRCCVKRVFTNSSAAVAATIKKWTSDKDRKKARQADYQKHQRKVRKEKKDIDKFEAKIVDLRGQLEVTPQVPLQTDDACEPAEHSERPGDGLLKAQLCKQSNNSINLNDSVPPNCDPNFESTEAQESSTIPIVLGGEDESSIDVKALVVEPTEPKLEDLPREQTDETTSNKTEKVKGSSKSSNQDTEKKIGELLQTVIDCRARLKALSLKAVERSKLDKEEDRLSEQLKVWCVRVRSLVLVPTNLETSNQSRPLAGGSLSSPMLELFQDAEMLGIAKYPDVHVVANAFQCISWSTLAMATLAKRSTLSEIQHVLNCCASIILPDEKALRILKSMLQRTVQWQAKARKCLAPKPGETRPFSMEHLKSLEFGCSAVPFEVPEASCLVNAIEDKGRRYCFCGGANDGSFMLGCDKCENWFHGRCVGVDKVTGNNLESWHCLVCRGEDMPTGCVENAPFEFADMEDDESSIAREDSPTAPTVEKLWPPFGLFGSTASHEALGEACLLIADTVGDLDQLVMSKRGSLPQADTHPSDPDKSLQDDECMTSSGHDNITSVEVTTLLAEAEKVSRRSHISQISVEHDEIGSAASKESCIAVLLSVTNNGTKFNQCRDTERLKCADSTTVAKATVSQAIEVLCSTPLTHMVSPDLEEIGEEETGARLLTSYNSMGDTSRMDCEDSFEENNGMDCDDGSQEIDDSHCDGGAHQSNGVEEIIPKNSLVTGDHDQKISPLKQETRIWEQTPEKLRSEPNITEIACAENTNSIDSFRPADSKGVIAGTTANADPWGSSEIDNTEEEAAAGKETSLVAEPITLTS